MENYRKEFGKFFRDFAEQNGIPYMQVSVDSDESLKELIARREV
jgi:hypothetical protein